MKRWSAEVSRTMLRENVASVEDSSERTKVAMSRLVCWLEQNGSKSYDVCDVQAQGLFLHGTMWARAGFPWNTIGKPLVVFERTCRKPLRRILRVRPRSFAQAEALIARGYLTIGQARERHDLVDRAREKLEWITTEACSSVDTGLAWGQPYDWPSRLIVPAYTPRATVTSTVIMALLDAWEILKEERWRSAAEQGARFLAEELPRFELGDGRICFHYTTIDSMKVHNANMVAAAALARAGAASGISEWIEIALCAARFTASDQNHDGSWYYEYPNDPPTKIDHYHTGFVLEAFADLKRTLGPRFPFDAELTNGMAFYRSQMFDGIVPKMTPSQMYPIDIQSCAQAIITLLSAGDCDEDIRFAEEVANWTVANFQERDGTFHYRHYARREDRIPYVRWGQAWMLRALADVAEQARRQRAVT